jgi:hypothetical protein
MSGCQTCGGYGNRHDLIAHGWGPEYGGDDCEHEWTGWMDVGTCELRECIFCGAEDDR